ncbi:hypothetical protein M231_04519 [Tremella mesenterica]|uniref:Uncharacterized protein n=1 Tax=Tremella mesenterica TaxID=5217 RepID=A0A4Q1BKI6_TREME|nr:hypothetical protein M231_04519 [Tremella mesenterica]
MSQPTSPTLEGSVSGETRAERHDCRNLQAEFQEMRQLYQEQIAELRSELEALRTASVVVNTEGGRNIEENDNTIREPTAHSSPPNRTQNISVEITRNMETPIRNRSTSLRIQRNSIL